MINNDDEDVKVRVRFITQHEKFRVTETPFMVPTTLGRKGLSEVITHLLEGNSNESPMVFDFMIQGNLIRIPLSKFLSRFKNSISTEDTITIEYFPAANIDNDKVNSPITVPGWIGSVSSINVRNQEMVVAGCYDGNVQIIVSTSLFESQPDTSSRIDFQAHSEPVRALCTWTTDIDSTTLKSSQGRKVKSDKSPNYVSIATASKDHTVKLWSVALHNSTPRLMSTLKCTSSAESLNISPIASSASPSQSQQSLLLCGDWSGCLRGWKLPTDLLATPGAADVEDATKRRKVDSSSSLALGSVDPQVSFTIKAHSQALSGLDMDCNSSSLLSCSWDHSLKLWDLERQDCVATLVCPKVATSVQRRPLTGDAAGSVAATSHADGKVRLWDTRVGGATEVNHATSVASFGRSTQWISQVRWLPGSEFLFCAADYSGAVTLWDCRASTPLAYNVAHSGKALCVGWTSIPAKSSGSSEVVKGGESGMGGNRSSRRKLAIAEENIMQEEAQWVMVSGGSDSCLRATPLTRTY